jgi:ABC-type Fe3+-hydroxamate transport system substrate-binding protein
MAPIRRTTALAVLAGMTVVAGLAGCSSDAGTGAGTTAPVPETRTWDNVDGTTVVIPAEPERIVLVDPDPATAAVARTTAGDRVVGVSVPADRDAEIERPDGWTELSPGRAPASASVAEVRPDLIVSHPDVAGNGRLSEIAPVALLPREDGDRWRRASVRAGRLLGTQVAVTSRIRDADDRIATLRAQIAPITTLTPLEVRPDGMVARRGAHPEPLLDELGIRLPAALRRAGGTDCCVPVDVDALDRFDADYVFVAVDPVPAAEERYAELTADPQWRALGAAQREDLHRVNARAWAQATLPGVETALDDVERYVIAAQGG